MKIGVVANWLAGIFALAAMIVSYQLTLKHVTDSPVASWFESGCSEKPGAGSANCAAVLHSPFSVFPPRRENETPNQAHLPVAFLGLVYYSTLFIWLIGVSRPSYSRRWLHYLAILFVALGLSVSGYFIFIMFKVLTEWCPWCLVTHCLNLLIAICMLLMWPRRPSEVHAGPLYAGPVTTCSNADARTPAPAVDYWSYSADVFHTHPSWRLLLLTLLGIVIISLSHFNMLASKNAQRVATAYMQGLQGCEGRLQPYLKDAEQRFRDWEAGKKYPIEIRLDDPIRVLAADGNSSPPIDVVVFSDFECPMCGKFAGFFDEQVPRLFGGHIREIFKHYPLDQSCNTRVGSTMHLHACEAVRLAEAARSLKGNPGFWRAHDYIYKHQNDLKQGVLRPEMVAASIGVDTASFSNAMSSANFQSRVNGDADQARICEIRGTPSVFVDGKPVDSLIAQEIGFWDKLADAYWKRMNQPRPANTMLTAASPVSATTIPDSPGSKVAP
ncbi:MAG: vitamin K epoxide reductase family protein [Planctomycetes bacterium]|nr:vitamin K epoxide reductase family protein [Planctomycetota bacterium]MBI3834059.1 vitamin K epoxide reductase family protein [Planctomycetota bacterium]